MIYVLVIFVLLFCNAFFVAAEFALVAISKPSMEHLAEKGNRRAKQILEIISNASLQDRYIATVQVGITLASLGLGMYGEELLAEKLVHLFHDAGFAEFAFSHLVATILALTLLTYLHVVLGEMVPKSVALCNTEKAMFWMVVPMLFFINVFTPVIFILNKICNGLLGLLGIERQTSTTSLHSQEELELIVDESEAEGMLRKETSEVVQHLFEFADRTAEDVMVPRVQVTSVLLTDFPGELEATIFSAGHTFYPVCDRDKDHIVGVVHIKELARIIQAGEKVSIPSVPVPFVPYTAKLQTVLESINQTPAQMVVVLDEYGGTAGIVTLKDVFEEVLGNFGIWEKLGTLTKDVALRVPGTARLDEVGERLNVVLEHEGVGTIGGLVLSVLNRPPRRGDVISFQSIQVEVTRTFGRGVHECLVRKSETVPPKVA